MDTHYYITDKIQPPQAKAMELWLKITPAIMELQTLLILYSVLTLDKAEILNFSYNIYIYVLNAVCCSICINLYFYKHTSKVFPECLFLHWFLGTKLCFFTLLVPLPSRPCYCVVLLLRTRNYVPRVSAITRVDCQYISRFAILLLSKILIFFFALFLQIWTRS